METLAAACIGVVIGGLSGILLFFVFVKALTSKGVATAIGLFTAEVTALPAFIFGGGWATTTLLTDINLNKNAAAYAVAISITLALIVAFLFWPRLQRLRMPGPTGTEQSND